MVIVIAAVFFTTLLEVDGERARLRLGVVLRGHLVVVGGRH